MKATMTQCWVKMRGPAKRLSRCVPKTVEIRGIKLNGGKRSILIMLNDGRDIEIDVSSEMAREQLRWLLKEGRSK